MNLSSRSLFACYCLLLVAYTCGAVVPLMNNDSAHHAGIALHILESGDWSALVTQGEPYKDKPHLLFWLGALSFKLFGVNTLAYKLPSLLFSILAVFSTIRLGTLLHGAEAGRLAGLVLASALAFALANNDVRMDALLAAHIIFATWQLAEFVAHGRWRHLLLGGLGLALGLATKGMIGVAMPLIAIFIHLLARRDWRRLFDPRWLALPVIVLVCAAPVLVAYYQQFGVEGVRFILWSQNFERLAGDRFGNAGADDPWFFFHTFAWAFLPWSLLTAWAFVATLGQRLRSGLRDGEMLTIGIIVVMFAIISASHFKLPHYLNILLPFFAILLAGWLTTRRGGLRPILWVQGISLLLLAVLAGVLNGWAMPAGLPMLLASGVLLAAGIGLARRESPGLPRIIIVSAGAAATFLLLLNANFYPQLLGYQAGTQLGHQVLQRQLPLDQVFTLHNQGRAGSFDVTTGRLTPVLTLDELRARRTPTVLFTLPSGLAAVQAAGLPVEILADAPDYRVTRLTPSFLDPQKRPQTLNRMLLLRVTP